jgi:hypothetical protein
LRRTEGFFTGAPRAAFHFAVNKLMEAFMEATMENLGMLSLGSFAGGVLCLGLPLKPEDFKIEELMKVTLFVLSTAIAGPIFTWIGKLGGASKLGEALFAYPIGLLLALLWYYVRMSLLNLGSNNKNVKLVAFAHIVGVTIMTLVAAYVFAWPLITTV